MANLYLGTEVLFRGVRPLHRPRRMRTVIYGSWEQTRHDKGGTQDNRQGRTI